MIENRLKALLEKNFDCQRLEIVNESDLHDGHNASPNSGQSHFRVIITSNDFKNRSRLQCHQLVNNAVKPLFEEGLHALSIQTYTDTN